jgi:hypothetical protein
VITFSDNITKSGLLKEEPHIVLRGVVSFDVLKNVQSAFSEKDINANERRIFFVNYSDVDIAIGTCFQKAFDLRTNDVTSVNCHLEEVTQQFARPFDHIPAGWKTICKFKFSGGIPLLITSLPVVDDWFDSRSEYIVLTTDKFWEKYKRLTLV